MLSSLTAWNDPDGIGKAPHSWQDPDTLTVTRRSIFPSRLLAGMSVKLAFIYSKHLDHGLFCLERGNGEGMEG